MLTRPKNTTFPRNTSAIIRDSSVSFVGVATRSFDMYYVATEEIMTIKNSFKSCRTP